MSILTPGGGMIRTSSIVDRALEIPAVEDKLGRILEDVWDCLFLMRFELVAALAHHIPEEDRALGGVPHVFERGREWIGGRCGSVSIASGFDLDCMAPSPLLAASLRVLAESPACPGAPSADCGSRVVAPTAAALKQARGSRRDPFG